MLSNGRKKRGGAIFRVARAYIISMNIRCKNAASAVRTCATLVGTVVGAGFVSGAELVRFFPSEGFAAYSYLAAALFFMGFSLLFYGGNKFGGFDGLLRAAFKKFAPAVRLFVLGCLLAVCAGMLAGLDSVMSQGFGVPKNIPILSLAVLALVFFLCGRGIGTIGTVNLCLVPAILAFVVWLAFGDLDFGYTFSPSQDAFNGMAAVFLYSGMNIFLAAPVVCDLGARAGGKGMGGCLAAGLAAAVIIGASIAVILATVFAEGAGAAGADMPLLYAIGGGIAGKIFAAVSAFGIVTTLFSSYYPLHERCKVSKKPRIWRIAVAAAAFGLSRFGLKTIVEVVYPLLGGLGILFLCVCAYAALRRTPPASQAVNGVRLRRKRGACGGRKKKKHARAVV